MPEEQAIHRIEVGIQSDDNLEAAIKEDLNISSIKKVEVIHVYTIEGGSFSSKDLEFISKEVFSDPVVETSEILSEQLLLSLPAHHFCDEACKGLCDRCGVNLNEKQCKCRETNENSPFAVLKQLQK